MSGTIRTDVYLTGTEFPDNLPDGTITPAYIRDIVASKPNITDLYDDAANASGLSAPAILRGTVYGHKASGVTVGSGQTQTVQTATAAGLQNALNYAAVHGKYFDLEPGVYEIYSATGLTIPAQGFGKYTMCLRGSRSGTVISQFYASSTGAPVLTIGDPSSNGVYSVGLDIQGLTLRYGVSQAGLTSSSCLVIGAATVGVIADIAVCDLSGFPGYNGIVIQSTGGGGANFSMNYRNISCSTCQQDILKIAASGTGNVFSNIYLNNGGSGVYNALAGHYVNFATGTNEMTFDQLNCEWGAVNQLLNIQDNPGTQFRCLHIEGIKMTGFAPALLWLSNSNVGIHTLNIIDCLVQTANLTGTPSVASDYNEVSSCVRVDNFTWTMNATGQVTAPMSLYNVSQSNPDADLPTMTVNAGWLKDQTGSSQFIGNFSFDYHMPVGASQFLAPLRWSGYEYGASGSTVKKAAIKISANYTHYGQHEDAYLIVPVSITSFTITLAATMGATGTLPPKTGSRVRVRRLSGTAAGTLTVKDDAGTTLATNTTAATNLDFYFNGTHYVSFTPVT